MILRYPADAEISELKSSNRLEEALNLYAQILLQATDKKQVSLWLKAYLSPSTDKQIIDHHLLKKAAFFLIFRENLLKDSPVDVYWDIVLRFGPTNQTAVVDLLNSAPRSVPLKFGRLLIYTAEFGKPSSVSSTDFEKSLVVVFSSLALAHAVITDDWKTQVSRFRTLESRTLRKFAEFFMKNGPVDALVTILPQLTRPQAFALLNVTKKPVEELTQLVLDDPNFLNNTLRPQIAKSKSKTRRQSKKFVLLDEHEKQKREDAIRLHNQLNFTYEYVSLEDEDPEPEDEGPVGHELSEADKKLVAQEELLWKQWDTDKTVFDRGNRKSEGRKQLAAKLKWTDEQIEGWARMIGSKGRNGGSEQLPASMQETVSYAPGNRDPQADVKRKERQKATKTAKNSSGKEPSKPDTPKKPSSAQLRNQPRTRKSGKKAQNNKEK